jgi:signal transduction histidine kinase
MRLPFVGHGSLGARLLLILTGVGLAGAIGITLLLAAVITPSFNTLEARAVDAHVERTRAALTDFAADVEKTVRDYGDWTESYEFIARPTPAFEAESLSPLAMSNLGVQGMAYVRPGGEVLIARWRGAGGEGMRGRLLRHLAATDLQRVLGQRSSASYFAQMGDRLVAVGIARIRRSDGTGTPRGVVLMARVLTSAAISELLQVRAGVELGATGPLSARKSRSRLAIAVPIPGADGQAVGAARFEVVRDVSMLGRRMLLLAVAGSTVLLLLILVVLRRVIARLVLEPLHRVESHMQRVRASGSLALVQEERRADEVGSLVRSFNAMLSQLRTLREQIEAQSFALGKSESAVAVMHNVRNALNPVSTILSQGVAQAPPVDRRTLDRALAELARDDVAGARRQKLAAFVAAAAEADVQARERHRQELQVGREAMAQVLEIIGQQQKNAHERPQLEPVDVSDIIARNAAIARYSLSVSIAFSFPGLPHMAMANRVILSQVVGNLLGNAAEAIAATGRDGGSIAVEVREGGGETQVRLRDDGEGFDPELAPSLFQRGFSTREHKSGGLGLHWCANAMTGMDGSLRLESEGRGKGATAVLTLKTAGLALAEAA